MYFVHLSLLCQLPGLWQYHQQWSLLSQHIWGHPDHVHIFFWCTVILGISRKEMSLSLRSNFRISQHCANRLVTGRGKWVLFPLSQVEVDVWCHAEGVALGHNREHGPPMESSRFPAWCSAHVLLFTAFCQCPEDGKARMEAQRKSPDGRHKIAHVSQSLLSSSHVLVVTKQNRTHCLYVAAFLWSISRVATQPFPARLEIFAITWLPVRQLNLTVWGGAAVAPPPCQQQWWQLGCPTHTSLLHCSDPPGFFHQPGHLPSATAKPCQQQPLQLCFLFKATDPEEAPTVHSQCKAVLTHCWGTGHHLLHLTRSCCILAYLFPLVQ